MTELCLGGNETDFAGALAISVLPRLAPALTKLHLEDAKISDAGATLLCARPRPASAQGTTLGRQSTHADGIREVLDSDKLQNTIIGADTANLAVAVGQELDRRLVQRAQRLAVVIVENIRRLSHSTASQPIIRSIILENGAAGLGAAIHPVIGLYPEIKQQGGEFPALLLYVMNITSDDHHYWP